MANHHGTEGIVKVGTATVAEVNDFSLTERADFAEDTNLADTDVTRNPQGIVDRSGQVSAFWDETDTLGQEAMVIGAQVTLNLLLEGDVIGDIQFAGPALIEEIVRTSQRGSIVEVTFNWVQAGAWARTVLP